MGSVTTEDQSASASLIKLPRNVKILGWASFLNDVASEMIFPVLPQFLLAVLGGNKGFLGLIEGTADSLSSLLKLFAGGWSDRRAARKGFVVGGYAVASLVRPLIGVIFHPWQLLLIRVGDRLGKGLRTPPRDALIVDCTPPEKRGWAFGFQRGMDHLGAAVGPLLATVFLLFWPEQWRILFLCTVVPGLLVVVLLVFGLRETPSLISQPSSPGSKNQDQNECRSQSLAPHPSPLTLRPSSLLRSLNGFDRRFRRYLITLVIFTLGNSSDAFLLVRAGELGVATAYLPLLWCVFHVFKGGGNWACGRLVDRWQPRVMIVLGWFLYAVIYFAFALAGAAWQMWLLFGAYAFFYALTEPAEKTLVANLAGQQQRGLAFGWFHFAVGITTLPASLLFGLIYQFGGPLAAFGWGAGLALLAALLLWGFIQPGKESSVGRRQ
jgi:MFS family permease